MSVNELEIKCRELKELQRLIEEAEAEAEAIKDSLKNFMGDNEELNAGAFKISYRNVTSSRVDTAALKKAAPELVAAFTRQNTIRRFCVN